MNVRCLVTILVLCSIRLSAQSVLQKENQEVVKVDPRTTEDFFQYVFDFEIIALKGDEDLILPSLKLIGTTNNRIFATTRSFRRNPVYVFDQAGNHIKTIQRAGGGPGEYQGIRGVIPYKNGDFGLEDISGKQILVFDSLGNYKSAHTWSQFTYGIKSGAEGYFSLLPEDLQEQYGRVGVMDKIFALDTGFLDSPTEGRSRISTGNQLQAYLGGFAYLEANTTGLYHGNGQEVWPAYFFNFGPYAPEITSNGVPAFNDKVSMLCFYETEGCVYMEYAFGMRNFQLSVYSKRDGQVTNHSLKQLIGEELLGLSIADEQWMYLSIPAPAVPELLKRAGAESAVFANGLTAEEVLSSENPVILRYKFL